MALLRIEKQCRVLEAGQCPSSLVLLQAVLVLVKVTSAWFIWGPSILRQVGQLQSDSAVQLVVKWNGMAVTQQPPLWIEWQSCIAQQYGDKPSSWQQLAWCHVRNYMARLPLLPWRQGIARILFIIKSLAAGGRHTVSALVSCACHLFGRV